MSFSGGVYTLPGPALVTGEVVSATENNQFRNDVAGAFNVTMLRNGTSTATANLPMGGYKLTGLGAPTTNGDALSYGAAAVVTTLTSTSLTATRVPYAGTGGLLQDASTFTFDGTTLTAGGFTTSGAISAGTITASGAITVSGGTANGVAYLNGSKVLTTGSALTFDGTNLGLGSSTINTYYDRTQQIYGTASSSLKLTNATAGTANTDGFDVALNGTTALLYNRENGDMAFGVNNVEGMRLTSTGLGIGTSSPQSKLVVKTQTNANAEFRTTDVVFGTVVGGVAIDTLNDARSTTVPFGVRGMGVYINDTTGTTTFSGGNLGLGVTPSAWSVYKAFSIAGTGQGIAGSSGGETQVLANTYYNSGWKYAATQGAARFAVGESFNDFRWYQAPSGTAGNAISFTQAMTLDASGNLLVGATSNASAYRAQFTGTGSGVVGVRSSGSYSGIEFADNGTSSTPSIYSNGNALTSWTSGSERMRIDSSGNVMINKTSATSGAGRFQIVGDADTNVSTFQVASNGYAACVFNNASNAVSGYVTVNASTVTYNTSSDYRLKENIQPMQNALDVVAQLNPVTYTWKADGSDGQGFIAHELQAVVPDCVTGEKDAVDAEGKPVYQGIDTSFLVATLCKAIQELEARVKQLEGK